MWGFKMNRFSNKLRKEATNDEDTSFWDDTWIDGIPLRTRFSSLFLLSKGKNATVQDII